MTTYNHEKYIAESIQSILNQDFPDFELIVVDDGSIDQTASIIKQFNDPRVHYHYQENMGVSAAVNAGIKLAKASYIALMSGDDIATPWRIGKEYQYLENHPDINIVFGKIEIIDHKSKVLKSHHLNEFFNDFIDTKMDRYAAFRFFFFNGNRLNSVTAMFKRDCILKTGKYQLASLQLQDYLMWLNFLKLGKIGLLDSTVAKYRLLKKQRNLSNEKNYRRTQFEYFAVLDQIFDAIDMDFFKQSFKDDLLHPNFEDSHSFNLEKAYLYLKHSSDMVKMIGLKKLFQLLQDDEFRNVYLHSYKKTMREYYQLSNQINFINNEKSILQRLKRKLLACSKKLSALLTG
ncbi:MAG: hypothetical protein K0S29_342 [Gammaproteobacteria bacterium]|nr:hypothetical protein [Gammaproteobacteria bacterium]